MSSQFISLTFLYFYVVIKLTSALLSGRVGHRFNLIVGVVYKVVSIGKNTRLKSPLFIDGLLMSLSKKQSAGNTRLSIFCNVIKNSPGHILLHMHHSLSLES